MRASKRAREGDFRAAVPGLANVYSADGTVQSRQDAEQRPQRQSRPRNVSVRDAARPTSPEGAPADPRPPPRALSGRQLDALRESTAVVQRWLEGERGGLLDERTVCACVVTSLLRLGREEAAVGTRLVCQAAGPGNRAGVSAACTAIANDYRLKFPLNATRNAPLDRIRIMPYARHGSGSSR